MTEKRDRQPTTNKTPPADEPTPALPDPGGAHNKGYSADPGPEEAIEATVPIPLAPGPAHHPAVRVPERDNHVQPTGRSEPHDYTGNDQLMGSEG